MTDDGRIHALSTRAELPFDPKEKHFNAMLKSFRRWRWTARGLLAIQHSGAASSDNPDILMLEGMSVFLQSWSVNRFFTAPGVYNDQVMREPILKLMPEAARNYPVCAPAIHQCVLAILRVDDLLMLQDAFAKRRQPTTYNYDAEW